MKIFRRIIPFFLIGMASFSSCSDWTDVELKDIDHIGGYNTNCNAESEEYYSNLRAWKETSKNYGRPVSFGWFSNWSPTGAVRKGYLTSLPDSIDMVSMWSGPFNISEAKKRDKEFVQKVKGTKVFVCYILHNIGTGITPAWVAQKTIDENKGKSEKDVNILVSKAVDEYWGYTSGVQGSADHIEAIRKYAKVLCDSIVKYDYDGLDIDWEPNGAGDGYGNLKCYDGEPGKYLAVLVEALSEYLGPKATKNTGKYRYLLVDGELQNVSRESGQYFDYFITQAYGSSWLDGRVKTVQRTFGEYYDTRKHIFTENFESYSKNGGKLLKQAAYNSAQGPKGGVGAFRLDNDYDNYPDYKYVRQAIQINQESYKKYMDNKKEDNSEI